MQVSRESVRQEQTDYSSLASQVPDDADFVFLPWQLAANAQQFGRQLSEQGKDARIFGSDGLYSPDDFNLNGSLVSAFAPDITSVPESRAIVTAYRRDNGDFGTFGPPTYVAILVAMEAAKDACGASQDPTREQVAEQVLRVNLSETILGYPIAFDNKGDARNAEFFVFEVRNRKFVAAPQQ